jgi:hypothetical protein
MLKGMGRCNEKYEKVKTYRTSAQVAEEHRLIG